MELPIDETPVRINGLSMYEAIKTLGKVGTGAGSIYVSLALFRLVVKQKNTNAVQ